MWARFAFPLCGLRTLQPRGKRLMLRCDEDLQFGSHVLAELFDTLHEIMLGDDIPYETDWMLAKMIEIVGAGNAKKEGVFAGAAPEHPGMVRVVRTSGH